MSNHLDTIKQQLDELAEDYQIKKNLLLKDIPIEDLRILDEPQKDIRFIDSFMANGNKYLIRTSLTITRFEEFEKLQVQVGYGLNFKQLFANLNKAYGHLNEMQPADAAVIIYNMIKGVQHNLEMRDNEVLMLCALFICREDEDMTKFDPMYMSSKINDWKTEGITMDNFFIIASSLVVGFAPSFKDGLQSILAKLEAAKEEAEIKQKKNA